MATYGSNDVLQESMQPSSSNQDSNGRTLLRNIGAGLSNLGNTCFLNSVLQCLTYTPPLVYYLESGQHKATCWTTGFCSVCALQDHVKHVLISTGGLVSPAFIVKNLKSVSKTFRQWRQEDAHEYMRYLIESLDNCCARRQPSSSSSSQEPSVIQKIFGGQLRSQVKCSICSTASNTYDPFLDLSLEIVRADSLTKALTHFTTIEALDGDNEYYCANCKKKVPASKQFTIDKSPIILTIQLKRFSGTSSSGGKIDKNVTFGRTLAMTPYISNPQDSNANYSLYAVLVHAGWSTYSGHYYCFVRTAEGLWHNLDDSRVRQVSEKTVLDQKAYILFYMRDSTSQPSSTREQQEVEVCTNKKSWFTEGSNNIESNTNEDYEGDSSKSSKKSDISCNSSSHLGHAGSYKSANSSNLRYSIRKINRSSYRK